MWVVYKGKVYYYGGSSWSSSTLTLSSSGYYDLAVANDVLYAVNVYSNSGTGNYYINIYEYDSAASTWSNVYSSTYSMSFGFNGSTFKTISSLDGKLFVFRAYSTYNYQYVKAGVWNGSSFSESTIKSDFYATSLTPALDLDGQPMVAFADSPSDYFLYKYNGSSWLSQGTWSSNSVSVGLDGARYTGEYFVGNDGALWRTRVVDNGEEAFFYLDRDDTRYTNTASADSSTSTSITLSLTPSVKAYVQYGTDGVDWTTDGLASGTSYTVTGLNSGTRYYFRLWRERPWGATVNRLTALAWSASEGRGRVQLSWQAQAGAAGYKVWVIDGNAYRAFDVGNVTSWDSSVWKIYPSESQLDGYGDNTQGATCSTR